MLAIIVRLIPMLGPALVFAFVLLVVAAGEHALNNGFERDANGHSPRIFTKTGLRGWTVALILALVAGATRWFVDDVGGWAILFWLLMLAGIGFATFEFVGSGTEWRELIPFVVAVFAMGYPFMAANIAVQNTLLAEAGDFLKTAFDIVSWILLAASPVLMLLRLFREKGWRVASEVLVTLAVTGAVFLLVLGIEWEGLLFILVAISVFLAVAAGEHALNHGFERDANGRLPRIFAETGLRGWIVALILALVAGATMWFVGDVGNWARLFWLLMLAGIIFATVEFIRSGTEWRELIPFVAAVLLMGFPFMEAKIAAQKTVLTGEVGASVFNVLSWMLLAASPVLMLLRLFREKGWRVASKILVILAVIGAILLLIFGIEWGGIGTKGEEFETQAATQPASTGATESDERQGLDPRFVQQLEENSHDKWRLYSNFADCLRKNGGDTSATILEVSGHDAELLAIYAQGFGIYPDSSKYEELLTSDGTYLSDKGIALYYQLQGALAVCSAEREPAPANGTNTGYDNGFTIAAQPGVSGDRSATKYTTPTGEVVFVMDRCGNFVYPDSPPDIPPGNTDEKHPSEDPVNQGNADRGGGENKPSDGSGEVQQEDQRTVESPTGSAEDNHHGYSNPGTVTPATPPAPPEHANEDPSGTVVDENLMTYETDPVTDYGPVDSSAAPTPSEGDGEFAPPD